MDGFIRDYEGTSHLVLFGSEKYDALFHRIRYIIGLKSGITYVLSRNFVKNQSWLRWLFASTKKLAMNNVAMFVKTQFNKNQNHFLWCILR